MKLLSLFDGSGAFPLAAERLGITAQYASEVEPFPIAVTRHRFPNMLHLGDITKIDGGKIEPCELVTFGSPCTDISIAGKGEGLTAARSGLFFEAVRVIREMMEATNGDYPHYFLFENVPNLISIHKGEDWKIVMDSFTDLGFICDPNILDAQEFSVAQRRKRVFIVGINRKYYNPADFVDIPNNRNKRMQKAVDAWGGESFHGITCRPHEIKRQHLSEILEMDADPKYYLSQKACLGILRRVNAKGKQIPQLLRSALEYQAGLFNFSETESSAPLTFEPGATARLPNGKYWSDLSPTLRADAGDNSVSVVIPTPVAYGICSKESHSMNSHNPHSGVFQTDVSKTLDTSSQSANKNQGGMVVCVQGSVIGRKDENGPAGKGVNENLSFTLDTHDTPAVAYTMTTGCYAQVNEGRSPTLTARDFKDAPIVKSPALGYIVRRLTPRECLVLMDLC